ncbi:scavenger receptor cysteine-rich domain-containing group B protein-like [Cetorhinus maximus]
MVNPEHSQPIGVVWMLEKVDAENDTCDDLMMRLKVSKRKVLRCNWRIQVRLSDGESRRAGRVEIYYNGTWGSVCDDSWDLTDADVVCKQLGCGNALDASLAASCEPGSGPLWLDELKCSGNKSLLWKCPSASWDNRDCTHKEDVHTKPLIVPVSFQTFTSNVVSMFPFLTGANGMKEKPHTSQNCGREPDSRCSLRLVGGNTDCSGSAEILYNKTWRKVCGDSWDVADCNVVCRQLACCSALLAQGGAAFSLGDAVIWLDEVKCTGSESFLSDCPSSSPAQSDCDHREDVSVICSGFIISARLPNLDIFEQVLYNIFRGAVTRHWGSPAGLYQELYEEIDKIPSGINFTYTGGSENSHSQFFISGRPGDSQAPASETVMLRLVNGSNPCAGRVEVLFRGKWGTVWDYLWDLQDAAVVCRELDCGTALYARGKAQFGKGSGPVVTGRVECTGIEATLSGTMGNAFDLLEFRLLKGQPERRISIYSERHHLRPAAHTEKLENTEMERDQAVLVHVSHKAGGKFHSFPGSVNRNSVLLISGRPGENQTNPSEAVVLRLVNGSSTCDGRVEVLYRGRWGTVQDFRWDLPDAAVVCRELDCGTALSAWGKAQFGEGSGPVVAGNVECTGTEAALSLCRSRGWDHDSKYSHSGDAGVICSATDGFVSHGPV